MKKEQGSGYLKTNNVKLEKHEKITLDFLVRKGCTIELIVPSYTPNNKNPDFVMDGLLWEMKSPQGKELRTIEHAFKKAVRQSENIVIDLRRTKIGTKRVREFLEKCFKNSKRIRRMLLITKEKEMIDFHKR